jgi:hypothetical protein
MQAKTTKKIVLRMQCQDCKQTCMKGLKVSPEYREGGLQHKLTKVHRVIEFREGGLQHRSVASSVLFVSSLSCKFSISTIYLSDEKLLKLSIASLGSCILAHAHALIHSFYSRSPKTALQALRDRRR